MPPPRPEDRQIRAAVLSITARRDRSGTDPIGGPAVTGCSASRSTSPKRVLSSATGSRSCPATRTARVKPPIGRAVRRSTGRRATVWAPIAGSTTRVRPEGTPIPPRVRSGLRSIRAVPAGRGGRQPHPQTPARAVGPDRRCVLPANNCSPISECVRALSAARRRGCSGTRRHREPKILNITIA